MRNIWHVYSRNLWFFETKPFFTSTLIFQQQFVKLVPTWSHEVYFLYKGRTFANINKVSQGLRRAYRRNSRRVNFIINIFRIVLLCYSLIYSTNFYSTCVFYQIYEV